MYIKYLAQCLTYGKVQYILVLIILSLLLSAITHAENRAHVPLHS